MKKFTGTILFFSFILFASVADGQQVQTPNVLKSNPDNGLEYSDEWSTGFSTGASFGVKNDESALFRGNSMATKMFGRYYFGKLGLGLTTGFASGNISNNAINKFIAERNVSPDGLQIATSNPLNSYLLFGPSFRFGRKLFINADLHGGLFLNNPGSVKITQQGADRTLYGFDNGDKDFQPGFSGSISLNYPIGRFTHFFINGDYLQTATSIRILDKFSGYDVPMQVRRNVKTMIAGIGIIKTFGSKKESANHLPARSRKQIGQPHYGNKQSASPDNCGPVILNTTHADGSTSQMTFACSEDAIKYANQTKSHNQSPFQSPKNIADGIVYGTVFWSSANPENIVTNATAFKVKKDHDDHRRRLRTPPSEELVLATLYSSQNGRRPEKLFAEEKSESCTNCGITVAPIYGAVADSNGTIMNPLFEGKGTAGSNPMYEGSSIKGENPLYESNSMQGENPLYEGNGQSGSNPLYSQRIGGGGAEQICGKTGHFLVVLTNPGSDKPIAETRTDSCGNFWFANVPAGEYDVWISGNGVIQKNYEVNVITEGKHNISGQMKAGNARMMLTVGTQFGEGNFQKTKVIVRGWDPEKKEKITATTPQQRMAGNPIGGIVVKGGRNPGGQMKTIQTGEDGKFEFAGLEKGSYKITANIPYSFDARMNINTGDELEHRTQNNSNENKALQKLFAQDLSTTGSNRNNRLVSVSVDADTDGDGVFETDVTAQIKDEVQLDKEGKVTQAGEGKGFKGMTKRSFLTEINDGLFVSYGTATINGKEVPVKSILKTKHDTAKNSVSNIR